MAGAVLFHGERLVVSGKVSRFSVNRWVHDYTLRKEAECRVDRAMALITVATLPYEMLRDPKKNCGGKSPFEQNTGYSSARGYWYNISTPEESQKKYSLGGFLKETALGAITGGLTSAAFYGAGKGIEKLKESVKSSWNSKKIKTLYHYTNEKGVDGIVASKQLNPSLKANNPKDARYGDGQYLSDIKPDTQTPVSLAKKFINVPNKYKYTRYVEINVKGLNVIQGREGVFVIPNDSPLDLTGRIVSTGTVGRH